uniref:Uncharacterized protein n=1 Tax=Arundo donax TaxID=35708 RepID=A0A0A8YUR9_ARUDO
MTMTMSRGTHLSLGTSAQVHMRRC